MSESGTAERTDHRVADSSTLASLIPLLGIERFVAAACRPDLAEVIGDGIRVHFDWSGVGDAWILLRPATGAGRFCGSDTVDIVFQGAEISRPFELLMRRIAVSLSGRDIGDLKARFPAPAPRDEGGFKVSEINTWGGDSSWMEFVCDHAMERKFYESFTFEDPVSFVIHGDLECSFITPRSRYSLPRFYNYPWGLFGASEGSTAMTDLTDLDVIQGSEVKLSETVRKELERVPEEWPVIVNSTCVPIVIGDDVDGVVRRQRACTGRQIFHIGPRTIQPVDVFLQYLDIEKRKFREGGGRIRPGSVALVGFRADRARDELVKALNESGIPVSSCILPAAGRASMLGALEAELLVFRPSVLHAGIYESLFGDCPQTRISPPAPWGPGASVSWLRTIGEALGRETAIEAVIASRLAAFTAQEDVLRSRGHMPVLLFVVAPEKASRLLDPDSPAGLPMLPVILEMGFRGRVLVHAVRERVYGDFRDTVSSACPQGNLEILPFTSPRELEDALETPDVGAVFSEYFFDDRLTRAGVTSFSARDFEMGFEGAIRTRERLVHGSRLPFYRRYRQYIGGNRALVEA